MLKVGVPGAPTRAATEYGTLKVKPRVCKRAHARPTRAATKQRTE